MAKGNPYGPIPIFSPGLLSLCLNPAICILLFQMILEGGLENFKFYPFSGWFMTRQLSRRARAKADLPIRAESSDSQAGVGSAGRGL